MDINAICGNRLLAVMHSDFIASRKNQPQSFQHRCSHKCLYRPNGVTICNVTHTVFLLHTILIS